MGTWNPATTFKENFVNITRKTKLHFLIAAFSIMAIVAFVSGLVLVKDDLFGSNSDVGNPTLGWVDMGVTILFTTISFLYITSMIPQSTLCEAEERVTIKERTSELYKIAMADEVKKQKDYDVLKEAERAIARETLIAATKKLEPNLPTSVGPPAYESKTV